jgi:hypothetical protein
MLLFGRGVLVYRENSLRGKHTRERAQEVWFVNAVCGCEAQMLARIHKMHVLSSSRQLAEQCAPHSQPSKVHFERNATTTTNDNNLSSKQTTLRSATTTPTTYS